MYASATCPSCQYMLPKDFVWVRFVFGKPHSYCRAVNRKSLQSPAFIERDAWFAMVFGRDLKPFTCPNNSGTRVFIIFVFGLTVSSWQTMWKSRTEQLVVQACCLFLGGGVVAWVVNLAFPVSGMCSIDLYVLIQLTLIVSSCLCFFFFFFLWLLSCFNLVCFFFAWFPKTKAPVSVIRGQLPDRKCLNLLTSNIFGYRIIKGLWVHPVWFMLAIWRIIYNCPGNANLASFFCFLNVRRPCTHSVSVNLICCILEPQNEHLSFILIVISEFNCTDFLNCFINLIFIQAVGYSFLMNHFEGTTLLFWSPAAAFSPSRITNLVTKQVRSS